MTIYQVIGYVIYKNRNDIEDEYHFVVIRYISETMY